jgi:murein DD-endopeptidase MepM/ murein hydrolase activator NlpD
MKKFIFIAIFLCLAAAIFFISYNTLFPGSTDNKDNDVIRLENSIIVHGIQMETDMPVSERGNGPEGRIIYDDTFGDIIERNNAKEEPAFAAATKEDMAEFNRLKAKDPRWHLYDYKIKKMDNLWKIARRFGVNHRLIIGVNGINDPDMLKPGRLIRVPTMNGVTYQVKKGDTISSIAGRYRISGGRIIAHNQLRAGAIRAGQKIFLPDARELVVRRPAVPGQKKETADLASDLRSFTWPLQGKITSGFGKRTDPLSGQRRFHCGIDISANPGTPIYAVSDGRVIFSGWKPGYGNVVIVRHNGGYISVYAHNSKNLAEIDGAVAKGDTIAYSGSTGAVTGAHLHFELRKYMTPLNPMRIFQ